MGTSLILIFTLLASVSSVPSALTHPFCTQATGDMGKSVAWIRGNYGVLGSRGDQLYTGQLTLSGDEDSGSLRVLGTVNGSPRQGTARYIQCGPDRVKQLEIALEPDHTLYCALHTDYDNFHRMSCSRSLSDPNGDHELWVERYAP